MFVLQYSRYTVCSVLTEHNSTVSICPSRPTGDRMSVVISSAYSLTQPPFPRVAPAQNSQSWPDLNLRICTLFRKTILHFFCGNNSLPAFSRAPSSISTLPDLMNFLTLETFPSPADSTNSTTLGSIDRTTAPFEAFLMLLNCLFFAFPPACCREFERSQLYRPFASPG